MSALLCPECRDATRKHDDVGCRVPGCFCGQTRATLASALDELVSTTAHADAEVPDATPATPVEAADGGPVETTAADLPADPAADDAALDSPAGADGGALAEAPNRPGGDLPGTQPAPGESGHGSPIRGGEVTPAVEVEATTPAVTSTAGRLLASHVTWWCPRCLSGRELRRRCCPTDLIRARVTVTEEVADG